MERIETATLICRICLHEWDTAATCKTYEVAPGQEGTITDYENVDCPNCGNKNNFWDTTSEDKKVSGETVDRCYWAMREYIDCDEFYDILPGDGKDDYIIGELCKNMRNRFEKIKGSKISINPQTGERP